MVVASYVYIKNDAYIYVHIYTHAMDKMIYNNVNET